MATFIRMLLTALCTCAVTQLGAADPPASSSPTEPFAAPQSSAPTNAEPEAAAATAAPSAAPAKPNRTVVEDKTLTQNDVNQLLAQGYRPLNRDGQIYYCRRQTDTGSRFTSWHCRTGLEAKQVLQDSKDMVTMHQKTSERLPGPPEHP